MVVAVEERERERERFPLVVPPGLNGNGNGPDVGAGKSVYSGAYLRQAWCDRERELAALVALALNERPDLDRHANAAFLHGLISAFQI